MADVIYPNVNSHHKDSSSSLSGDLLEGAEAIAVYLFGDAKAKRKVYHLDDRGELPTFRLGAKIFARKSTIVRWIAEQEGKTP